MKGMKKIMGIMVVAILMAPAVFVTPARASESGEKYRVEVTEYRADGSLVKKFVELNREEVNRLKEDLMNAESMEERFLVLKEYGFTTASLDEWRNGMYRMARNMGIDTNGLNSPIPFSPPLMLSFFCKVNAVYILGGHLRIGVAPLVGFTKLIGGWKIFSTDLIDMCWGLFGVLEVKGLLRQHTMFGIPSFMCMAGFVGVHISIPMVLNTYTGFSAMTFAGGLGLHDIGFNLMGMALLGFIAGLMIGFMSGGFTGE